MEWGARREGETCQEGGEHARHGDTAGENQNLRLMGANGPDFDQWEADVLDNSPSARLGARAGRVRGGQRADSGHTDTHFHWVPGRMGTGEGA